MFFFSLWLGEKEYYKTQFETLKSFEEVDAIGHAETSDDEYEDEERIQHERAMKISNYANIVLLAFKVFF